MRECSEPEPILSTRLLKNISELWSVKQYATEMLSLLTVSGKNQTDEFNTLRISLADRALLQLLRDEQLRITERCRLTPRRNWK